MTGLSAEASVKVNRDGQRCRSCCLSIVSPEAIPSSLMRHVTIGKRSDRRLRALALEGGTSDSLGC